MLNFTFDPTDMESDAAYRFWDFYIPGRMMGGLRRYVEHGIIPGDFLEAVLRNDLRGACERADEENRVNLPAYVGWLYNEAPGGCWGSSAKVDAWVEQKRAEREAAA
jgi:hypothetical protein